MDPTREITATLAELGREFASWTLWMSLWTLALFAAARLADYALKRVVCARWRLCFYLAIPLRLCLPVVWSPPLAPGRP